MNKAETIEASKIAPTFLIGDALQVVSRDLKPSKKPPKYSEDCDSKFYEHIAKDNSKVTLLGDYSGKVCKDLINENFLNGADLSNDVTLQDLMLNRNNDELSGSKIVIFSTERTINYQVINLTARHKAQEAKLKALALCVLELEQTGILKSNLLPDFQKARVSQKPNKEGRLVL